MNEVHVDLDELGRVRLRRAGEGSGVYTLETTEALRAFFQAERDDALGRWRDTENPNVVVYPCLNQDDGYGRVVWVLDEAEMVSGTVLDDRHSHSSASHYFAAHPQPEPEPKPAGSVLPEKLNRFSKDDMAKAWVRGYKAGTEDTDDYMMGRQWHPKPNPYEQGDNQ